MEELNDRNIHSFVNKYYTEKYLFHKLTLPPISGWDVSKVTNMHNLFNGMTEFNESLDNWNVKKVTNMSSMFFGCNFFNQPLNNWDVTNVINMSSMFSGCSSFNQPLDNWDVTNATNMSRMFAGCSKFNQSLDNWNVNYKTNTHEMFKYATEFLNNNEITIIPSNTENKKIENYRLKIWDASTTPDDLPPPPTTPDDLPPPPTTPSPMEKYSSKSNATPKEIIDIDINEAINNYFKLKTKFEEDFKKMKEKIINNPDLSKKEKRNEFLKLKPKCINCKKPSKLGTIFTTSYLPKTEDSEAERVYKAKCGNMADPCSLNIELIFGGKITLDETMRIVRDEINDVKRQIIDDKNKLLFGLITSETVLENFEKDNNTINHLTSLYQDCVATYNETIDNPEKKKDLDQSITTAYGIIDQIKKYMAIYKRTNNKKYANDVANLYVKTLAPLLEKIRSLKYNENIVYKDESTKTYRLIQNKTTLNDLLVVSYNDDRVYNYDLGYGKNALSQSAGTGNIIIDIKDPVKHVPRDEPIIGKGNDGIDWHSSEYRTLWSRLPPKLKNEFKLNIDWMSEFMYKCVNSNNHCNLTTPPNLNLPPLETRLGKYDFGVSIYNNVFNKLPTSLQDTYLTFYKENPVTKAKDYNMLETALNSLVQKELDYDKFI